MAKNPRNNAMFCKSEIFDNIYWHDTRSLYHKDEYDRLLFFKQSPDNKDCLGQYYHGLLKADYFYIQSIRVDVINQAVGKNGLSSISVLRKMKIIIAASGLNCIVLPVSLAMFQNFDQDDKGDLRILNNDNNSFFNLRDKGSVRFPDGFSMCIQCTRYVPNIEIMVTLKVSSFFTLKKHW